MPPAQHRPIPPGHPSPPSTRIRRARAVGNSDPSTGVPLQHPDFELYDNVGRTAEQIRAYHTRSATREDLRRWADRDAEAFRTRHPLPPEPFPAPDLSPYRTALDAADTPAEFSTVLNTLLDAVELFLNEVIDHLAATAKWKGRNRGAEPGSPPWLLRGAASSIATALAMATEADLNILHAHYDPPPDLDALLKQTRIAPATPPAPPDPQPGPGKPRR
ncbi:hypothetical protein [Streptomyces sp. NPDC047061]|uniref:hypothetical protein n=1 Tax=Streptomyces sp. NPDC047061 TaxID=3154605 RepID=UPI0033CB3A72